MVVRFRRGPHDHLGALPGGSKLGRVTVQGELFPAGGTGHRDLLHGPEDGVPPLVRGQQVQAALAGQFHVHAQAVGEVTQLLHKLRAGAGDGLGVDVAAKAVFAPQQPQHRQHPLGGVVRAAQHGAGQKQPLDVVAAVELHGQFGQLPGRKGSAGDIVGLAVDAVAAIEGAAVGHQHLEQAHTAAVGGKGVAAPRCIAAAHGSGPRRAGSPAGGAGYVVFGAVGQNGQLIHECLFHKNAPPNGKKSIKEKAIRKTANGF